MGYVYCNLMKKSTEIKSDVRWCRVMKRNYFSPSFNHDKHYTNSFPFVFFLFSRSHSCSQYPLKFLWYKTNINFLLFHIIWLLFLFVVVTASINWNKYWTTWNKQSFSFSARSIKAYFNLVLISYFYCGNSAYFFSCFVLFGITQLFWDRHSSKKDKINN